MMPHLHSNSAHLSDKQASLEYFLQAFEKKVDASTKTCNMHTLQQMLTALKERPSARRKGRIPSIKSLRETVQDERERVLLDFSLSYKPDQLVKYFDWFFQFLEYLKELKRQFDDKIYGPLRMYFTNHGFTPSTSQSFSRSSFVSERGVQLQFGAGVDVLKIYQGSRDGSTHRSSDGFYSTRLKAEFKELSEIYDDSEISNCSNSLLNSTDVLDNLLDENRDLLLEFDPGSISSESSNDKGPRRDVSAIISLITEILVTLQKSADIAKGWLKTYGEKSKHFKAKLKKISELQQKMSSKLHNIDKDVAVHEQTLTKQAKELDKLVKREQRSDDIKSKLYDIDTNENMVRELLHIANKQRHEIAQMMLEPDAFDERGTSELRLKYDENKLKRYVLDKKLKSLQYQKALLKSDLHMELEHKPNLIRFTNDAQEACEKMEESLEDSKRLKRDIERALGPLQLDKEYLELELDTCPPVPDFYGGFDFSGITAYSESYLSTPDKDNNSIERPIVELISDLDNDDEDESPRELQITEIKEETKPEKVKKKPKKNHIVKHPPWQLNYKPTTIGKTPKKTAKRVIEKQEEIPKPKVATTAPFHTKNYDPKLKADSIPTRKDKPHIITEKPKEKQNEKYDPKLKAESPFPPQNKKPMDIPKDSNEKKKSHLANVVTDHKGYLPSDANPTQLKSENQYQGNRDSSVNNHGPTPRAIDTEAEDKTVKALIRLPSHTLLPSEVRSRFHSLKEDTFTNKKNNRLKREIENDPYDAYLKDQQRNAFVTSNPQNEQINPAKSILKQEKRSTTRPKKDVSDNPPNVPKKDVTNNPPNAPKKALTDNSANAQITHTKPTRDTKYRPRPVNKPDMVDDPRVRMVQTKHTPKLMDTPGVLSDQVVNKEQTQDQESTQKNESVKQTGTESQSLGSVHIGSKKKPTATTTKVEPEQKREPSPEIRLRVPKYRGERPVVYKRDVAPAKQTDPIESVNGQDLESIEQTDKPRETTDIKKQDHTSTEPVSKVRFEDNVDIIDEGNKNKNDEKVKAKGKIHRKGGNKISPWYQQSKIT